MPKILPEGAKEAFARDGYWFPLRVMPAVARVQSDRRFGEARAPVCAFAGSG